MKYLIVDDSKIIRETFIHPIPQNVDQIIECSDGDEALEVYSNCLPDWVLMDIESYKNAAIKVGADWFYSKDNWE